jgi:acyl-CoA synthetase (AMP-forming)/AMP-acid ligase II
LVNTVPSVLAAYLATGHRLPSSVDTVTLAGETISPSLLSALFQHEHIQHVYNLYGPSEATVYATAERINPRERRHTVIGRPIANMRAYVVDEAGQPVASGIRGEIWLGGHGVARGYLGRADLTTERFVEDSFEPGTETRLYRTGDLGRYLPDGRLEYLGRRDGQVKVRGFRIELGEIEVVLLGHPAIREVLVAVVDQRLVAYVVGRTGHVSSSNLRQFAQGRLPRYMVPSAFVHLEALPRTPSGKLDARQLPAPTDEMPGVALGPQARNDLERGVAVIWCEVLGQEVVGVRDNFFDLGGHSLLLLVVQQRVRETLHRDVSIVDLFTYPTVESLATRLADGVSQVLEEDRADG